MKAYLDVAKATSLDTDTTAKMSDGLTFDKTTTNQITITDQLTASLQIGSAGRVGLLTLKTTDDQEAVIVNGKEDVVSFHVDVGDAKFDEDVIITGGLTLGSTDYTDLMSAMKQYFELLKVCKEVANAVLVRVDICPSTEKCASIGPDGVYGIWKCSESDKFCNTPSPAPAPAPGSDPCDPNPCDLQTEEKFCINDGRCVACTANSHCAEQMVCVNNACKPPEFEFSPGPNPAP
jgi:hypothetical protein